MPEQTKITEREAIQKVVDLMNEARNIIRSLEDPEARKRIAAYTDMFAGDIGVEFISEE